jgi:diguanylate cyclase (GGDEF)-like protein
MKGFLKANINRLSQKALRFQEDDVVYTGVRAASLIAAFIWNIFFAPTPRIQYGVFWILSLFLIYSVLAYIYFVVNKKINFSDIYKFLLLPDFFVVTGIVYLTKGEESPFIYGYYLLVALSSFYFGLWPGLGMALIAQITDVILTTSVLAPSPQSPDEAIFRWGFYWVLAFSGGLLSNKAKWEKKLLEQLTQELNQKMDTLNLIFDITHSISISLELSKLKALLIDTLSKAFNLEKFALILINPENNEVLMDIKTQVKEETVRKALQEFLTNQPSVSKRFLRSASPVYLTSGKWCFLSTLIKSDVVGVLMIEQQKCQTLSEDELSSLHLLSSQLALSLENSRLHEIAKQLSITDDLTELYNHRYFKQRLAEEIERAKRSKKPLALILLDLDNFKEYNDAFGHLKGDEALEKMGKVFKKISRKTDIPARYGGDEFAIICPETNLKMALKIAERFQKEISKIRIKETPSFKFTASVGISLFPKHAQKLEMLAKKADEALFEAKKAGKSMVKTA